MTIPEDLRYSKEHEWARKEGDVVRVGITHFAQDQLGDVVYVDLPAAGARVERMQPFGEVESTKSVSDLYAPLTGEVVAANGELEERPELVNDDPYGEGWMVTIRPDEGESLDHLLTAAGYRQHLEA